MNEKELEIAIEEEAKDVEMRKFIMLAGDQPTENESISFDKAFESAAKNKN